MESFRPILGITIGDPSGIGPEVVVKALSDPKVKEYCRPVVLGDIGAIDQALRICDLHSTAVAWSEETEPGAGSGTVEILPLSRLAPVDLQPGRPTPAGGRAAAEYIETGARLALAGRIQGLVTGPINKESLNQAGYRFPGHTEFLAALAGNPPVVMMLAGPRLRVVLVTVHTALQEVPGLLTMEGIISTAAITSHSLQQYFGLKEPRLAAAALNPHAGEKGLFGTEEQTIIGPAVRQAQERGINLTGPFPPDTLFYRAVNGEFDAVVCMYHDQGLIPLKLIHFKDGVNVTLGLPFIRTSVDHGTAYEIAGQNQADPESMISALQMAAQMARKKKAGPLLQTPGPD